MKNVNIGITNLIISNKLKESYFNDKLIIESKKLTKDFFDVVKNSPVLQLEFKVFNNIENKHIENEQAATRYIDNNIKLFEIYTNEEIEAEHKKLYEYIYPMMVSESIINQPNLDDDKVNLYLAIETLIRESLNYGNNVDVDELHEAFIAVLSHIQKPKKNLVENIEADEINEEILEIAVSKFNEKYGNLEEDDKNLVNSLIKVDINKKQELLEIFKSDTVKILNEIQDDTTKENVEKAIKKITEMKFDEETVDDNIIELHELKKELV
jgi:hypothetical protein